MESRYDYVLVGGGVASVWAAQNIRERDKEGKIVHVTDTPSADKHLAEMKEAVD